jgi:hypothetical protein
LRGNVCLTLSSQPLPSDDIETSTASPTPKVEEDVGQVRAAVAALEGVEEDEDEDEEVEKEEILVSAASKRKCPIEWSVLVGKGRFQNEYLMASQFEAANLLSQAIRRANESYKE